MYSYCKDEFEWLMIILEEGDCFSGWDDVASFIDDSLLKLRYMKKRFGYLFYDEEKYIKKINGRDVIVVDKEKQYVARNLKNQHFMEKMKMVK